MAKLEVLKGINFMKMPKNILSKVFIPFFTTKSRSEGMGLGLYIVRELCRSLEWEIEVSSQPGQGTKTVLIIGGDKIEHTKNYIS